VNSDVQGKAQGGGGILRFGGKGGGGGFSERSVESGGKKEGAPNINNNREDIEGGGRAKVAQMKGELQTKTSDARLRGKERKWLRKADQKWVLKKQLVHHRKKGKGKERFSTRRAPRQDGKEHRGTETGRR